MFPVLCRFLYIYISLFANLNCRAVVNVDIFVANKRKTSLATFQHRNRPLRFCVITTPTSRNPARDRIAAD